MKHRSGSVHLSQMWYTALFLCIVHVCEIICLSPLPSRLFKQRRTSFTARYGFQFPRASIFQFLCVTTSVLVCLQSPCGCGRGPSRSGWCYHFCTELCVLQQIAEIVPLLESGSHCWTSAAVLHLGLVLQELFSFLYGFLLRQALF